MSGSASAPKNVDWGRAERRVMGELVIVRRGRSEASSLDALPMRGVDRAETSAELGGDGGNG